MKSLYRYWYGSSAGYRYQYQGIGGTITESQICCTTTSPSLAVGVQRYYHVKQDNCQAQLQLQLQLQLELRLALIPINPTTHLPNRKSVFAKLSPAQSNSNSVG